MSTQIRRDETRKRSLYRAQVDAVSVMGLRSCACCKTVPRRLWRYWWESDNMTGRQREHEQRVSLPFCNAKCFHRYFGE